MRGRGRVWLENKQEESPDKPGSLSLPALRETDGDGYF